MFSIFVLLKKVFKKNTEFLLLFLISPYFYAFLSLPFTPLLKEKNKTQKIILLFLSLTEVKKNEKKTKKKNAPFVVS